MSKPDGGPAFPTDMERNGLLERHPGMTVRQYFAAHALFLMGCGLTEFKALSDVPAEFVPSALAKGAYEIADAMIAEGEK